jgi:hypothetical protein
MSLVKRFSTRSLAGAAMTTLLAFPVLVVVLNLIQHDQYNPVRQAMSDLALGRAGWLMAIAFCSLAVGSLLLAATLRRSLERAVVVPILLTAVSLLTFVSAAFQTDPDGAPATLHGTIHMAAGITTFVILIVTVASAAASFHRSQRWRGFRTVTAVWAFAALGTFFLVPLLGNAHFGVAQRTFVATCIAWMVVVAWRARRIESPAADERLQPSQTAAAGATAG